MAWSISVLLAVHENAHGAPPLMQAQAKMATMEEFHKMTNTTFSKGVIFKKKTIVAFPQELLKDIATSACVMLRGPDSTGTWRASGRWCTTRTCRR